MAHTAAATVITAARQVQAADIPLYLLQQLRDVHILSVLAQAAWFLQLEAVHYTGVAMASQAEQPTSLVITYQIFVLQAEKVVETTATIFADVIFLVVWATAEQLTPAAATVLTLDTVTHICGDGPLVDKQQWVHQTDHLVEIIAVYV